MRREGAPGLSVVAGTASLGHIVHFAAGDRGTSVQEYLAVANPGSADVHVRVTLSRAARWAAPSARSPSATFTVPANGCATRNIPSAMLAMANKSGGLMVTSDQPIVVERVRYIGNDLSSASYGATASAFHS
jgi:hypothetical protein